MSRSARPIRILGAGLAGLLAGSQFQRAHIFEGGPEEQVTHKAVLRFRSPAVGDAIGVPFRAVTVHKGVWHMGRFVEPNIQIANFYSRKVIQKLADRSVWNLAPAERWIAPNNLVELMAERCAGRITWDHVIDSNGFFGDGDTDTVSTMPMSLVAGWMPHANPPEFKSAGISVRRFTVADADIFQTIYFTDPSTTLYRASITGDLLIAEYAGEPHLEFDGEMLSAFGLVPADAQIKDATRQRLGKIAPIDDAWRKRFMLHLTQVHRVFSLGRYGCWRPGVLLDDVLHDTAVVRRLMSVGAYEQSQHAAR